MTKKILALVVAVMMVMALCVSVSATAVDFDVNGSSEELIIINFPEGVEYTIGDKVTVHFAGNSTGDFRVWLCNGQVTMSPEPLFKASENGFETGDFDFTIELEVGDKDGTGTTIANGILFKGPQWGVNLDNFTLTALEIVDGNDAAPEADAEPEAPAAEPEAPAAEPEAPAAEPAPAPAPAPATGLALAVVPAVMALAAVAVSKKH